MREAQSRRAANRKGDREEKKRGTSESEPLVLALDLGTSSMRAVIYDRQGRIVDGLVARAEYPMEITADGGVQAEPDAIVAVLEEVIDLVLDRAGARAEAIAAVAFSMLVPNVMGVDGDGRPITPVYTYADTRSQDAAAALRARLDQQAVHQRTGAPLHASYLPARLLWLHDAFPAVCRTARRWLSVGEYIYLRLFGDTRCSFSVASWTGLLNRRTLDWDRQLLDVIDVPAEALSPLGGPDHMLRGLRQPWAGRWPALADIPWFLPQGDGACSNIGAGCLTPHWVALSVGTSAALRVIIPRDPAMIIPAGLWLYQIDGHRSLLGGATTEGGGLYAWMRETLRLPEHDAALEAAIVAIPPDSHGLTILPFLAGERSPGWHDGARGLIAGLTLDTSPAAIIRAGMEAVAYRLGMIFECLYPHLPQDVSILASGGALQHSPLWTQMLADVFNHPVYLSAEPEASSRGAALLALEALSLLETLEAAPADVGRLFLPDPARTAVYQAAQARQQALYDTFFKL